MLTCQTQKEAAEAAGITTRTMRAYMTEKEFRREYQRRLGAIVEDAARQARQALNPAFEALREVVENPVERSSARIAAARAILEFTARYVELTDVIARIERLEEGANER